jgi:hypothetical protein
MSIKGGSINRPSSATTKIHNATGHTKTSSGQNEEAKGFLALQRQTNKKSAQFAT